MRSSILHLNRGRAGFTLVEALIAGGILAVFALGSAATLNVMNNVAARTRNAVIAQSIVHGYIDAALAVDYTATSTPAILATTTSGTDIDGDGEGDGAAYPGVNPANVVPLIVMRDSKTSGVQNNVITGEIYRHCTEVNTTLHIQRVTFLIRYQVANKYYYYKLATLKAREG